MTQEPIKGITNSGKGKLVGTLRISGFQVKQEEPKTDTTELDAWCAELIRKTEQGSKRRRKKKIHLR